MIATKEQEEYIKANVEKAVSNSIKMYGRTWWDNIYLEKLNIIKMKLSNLDLVNLTKDDYDLVMEWAEDIGDENL